MLEKKQPIFFFPKDPTRGGNFPLEKSTNHIFLKGGEKRKINCNRQGGNELVGRKEKKKGVSQSRNLEIHKKGEKGISIGPYSKGGKRPMQIGIMKRERLMNPSFIGGG